jgi:hypothetical protein
MGHELLLPPSLSNNDPHSKMISKSAPLDPNASFPMDCTLAGITTDRINVLLNAFFPILRSFDPGSKEIAERVEQSLKPYDSMDSKLAGN